MKNEKLTLKMFFIILFKGFLLFPFVMLFLMYVPYIDELLPFLWSSL